MKRVTTILAMATLTAIGSEAQASLVDSDISTMHLEGRSYSLRDYDDPKYDSGDIDVIIAAQNDSDFDDDFFVGTPTPLSVSVSTKVTNPHDSAFLAVDASSNWSSPDHGVVNLNAFSSLYYDGLTNIDGDKAQFSLNFRPFTGDTPRQFWQYNFTPTEDVQLTLDVSRTFHQNADGFPFVQDSEFLYFDINGSQVSPYLNDGDLLTYTFLSGQNYTIGLETIFFHYIYGALGDPYEETNVTTMSVAFDMAPVPVATDPGTGTGTGTNPNDPVVPEPATWITMIAGFGIVGAAMRRRSWARGTAIAC